MQSVGRFVRPIFQSKVQSMVQAHAGCAHGGRTCAGWWFLGGETGR